MSITYLNPTSSYDETDSTMADRPDNLDNLRIGLLDNGKTNSDIFLQHLSKLLEVRHENLTFDPLDKPSPFKPAPDEIIQDISVQYGAIITGVGD